MSLFEVGRRSAIIWGLLATLATAGCQPAAPDAAASKPRPVGVSIGGDPVIGKQLFLSKGCVACHRAPGVPEAVGTAGPDLRGLASRPKVAGVIDHTQEAMRDWLMDPPRLKRGTAMPNLGLSEVEATNLTAFMETLQ